MVFERVLVVVVVDAEDDGAIAVSAGIEVAQHVVPGAGIAARGAGAAEDVSGFRSQLVGLARKVGEAGVAERHDQVVAIFRLASPLAAEGHFRTLRSTSSAPPRGIETGSK